MFLRLACSQATNPNKARRADGVYRNFYMYKDQNDGSDLYKPISRWRRAIQNDFAARMTWTIKPANQGNHAPVVTLNGNRGIAVLRTSPQAGTRIGLSAAGSSDPDGDRLTYQWQVYAEASTASASIGSASSASATVTLPSSSRGKTIHVILTVSDGRLVSYRRVVITPR